MEISQNEKFSGQSTEWYFVYCLFVCLVWGFTSQSTIMVISRRSVHLTTLISWASYLGIKHSIKSPMKERLHLKQCIQNETSQQQSNKMRPCIDSPLMGHCIDSPPTG